MLNEAWDTFWSQKAWKRKLIAYYLPAQAGTWPGPPEGKPELDDTPPIPEDKYSKFEGREAKTERDFIPRHLLTSCPSLIEAAGAQGLVHVNEDETGDERAVSAFARFRNKPIQIYSAGLHGCTVVFVISRRAVWGVSAGPNLNSMRIALTSARRRISGKYSPKVMLKRKKNASTCSSSSACSTSLRARR